MKRGREDGLEQEIEAIKVEIEALKREKAKWEAKAEAAEREGNKAEAKEHLCRYDTINTQLASVQQRLDRKEASLVEESRLKREKAFASGTLFFAFSLPKLIPCSLIFEQIGPSCSLVLYASLLQQQRVF